MEKQLFNAKEIDKTVKPAKTNIIQSSENEKNKWVVYTEYEK